MQHAPPTLFRDAALERKRQRLHGDVRLDVPLPAWALTGLILLVAAGVAAVLVFGSYARSEPVVGWLTPDTGIVRVTVGAAGTVAAVAVGEGDRVAKGASLLTVSHDVALPALGDASQRMARQLASERGEVERRLALVADDFAGERRRMDAERRGLLAEREHLERELAVHVERTALAEALVDQIEGLVERGTVTRIERQRREENLLAKRAEAERLAAQVSAAAHRTAELDARLAALPTKAAIERAQLRERLAALDQRATEAARRGTVGLRAPVAGRVAAVMARPGQSVEAQEMVVSILPDGGTLEAELFVPSRAAGFLAPGQRVRLRYDAFPYQTFGVGEATVKIVSRTILTPRDLPDGPPSLGEPFFRVVATLHADRVAAGGADIPLQAGMTLRADIVLEERRLWEVVFRPILAAVQR
ncbi:HlyD family efflux transporter periplasmic adaptor subunit [Acuticoccus sp. I52.16.1]|uniref:HlyD family efflux transporter periplasmic adaptor subunit n=1 Tax=Acuticoccus sp. I52.16.1 TaxID=2928472 RepID=UPI001FD4CA5B|nr:HlyD family efflux transporter periplasmic adaptor subunit [Acuticoccus sp. I52.16.1]UOM34895.1 HlyD family efflux transporter periplasmic adaptor subunit [Acuticoccus sp. I52.16.1]